MSYLLDSDVLSSYLRAEEEWLRLVEELLPNGIAISSVTFMEVLQGVLSRPTPLATEARFDEVVSGILLMDFDERAARRCAQLRHDLTS